MKFREFLLNESQSNTKVDYIDINELFDMCKKFAHEYFDGNYIEGFKIKWKKSKNTASLYADNMLALKIDLTNGEILTDNMKDFNAFNDFAEALSSEINYNIKKLTIGRR